MDKTPCNSQEAEVRKGPWTMEEDLILINYIANHGEGVWNSLAKAAGLKRTGKSCRLRWLNYLRPDVKRGNITPEEQLLIMELHAKWGNRLVYIYKTTGGPKLQSIYQEGPTMKLRIFGEPESRSKLSKQKHFQGKVQRPMSKQAQAKCPLLHTRWKIIQHHNIH
ncbi:hypothetical protein CICLE_v10016820mg [Citrus x clementina]|uniref:Uncharacterized protein n=1 Tax=Citrus clementina TaxID=85681 RepID=V4UC01_CITCL|nr:myb-related protein 305 isoform X2 [Citrus x clementina]XP_024950397.2 MYB-like transcription factor EOBII isoform X2 [Citrus sinensis]ESR59766.1 hypothetical protein CICLE_v10016820mg [Citrus x clementina]